MRTGHWEGGAVGEVRTGHGMCVGAEAVLRDRPPVLWTWVSDSPSSRIPRSHTPPQQ